MRYLAIDHGKKRTGLAICDPMEIISSPLIILSDPLTLEKDILKIVKEERVEEFVIGLPLNMDGTEGFQAKLVKEFAENLSKKSNIPVNYQDERLSSYVADQKLDAGGMNWRKKKKKLDAVAAASILETFLENKRFNENQL